MTTTPDARRRTEPPQRVSRTKMMNNKATCIKPHLVPESDHLRPIFRYRGSPTPSLFAGVRPPQTRPNVIAPLVRMVQGRARLCYKQETRIAREHVLGRGQ